jgi:hypothetical protein
LKSETWDFISVGVHVPGTGVVDITLIAMRAGTVVGDEQGRVRTAAAQT